MLKFNSWLLVLVFLITSCRSYKEATLFDDINKGGSIDTRFSPYGSYKLKPKDNLYISVLSSNAEMNRMYNPAQSGTPNNLNNNYEGETNRSIYGYTIDENGNVLLPLIGTFNLQGKTVHEAEGIIQRKAETLFKDVSTKVRMLNYKVTIVGEVKNPGVYYNTEGDFTVLDAIAKAQGLTEYALIQEVLVMRPDRGKQDAFILNLNNRSALRSEGFYLLPDDVVIVKPAENKNRQLRAPVQNWIIPSVSLAVVLLNYLRNN